MGYVLITDPTLEPITLKEARQHLKLEDNADEDDLLKIYITAARQMCEEYTRRAMITQTWELRECKLSSESIMLEKTPVQSVTSVKYYDTAGTLQTLSASYYTLTGASEPARIVLNSGYTWPVTRGNAEDAVIRFVSGYTSPDNVPEPLKAAMLLIIGHLHSNREDVISGKTITEIPMGSRYLMDPYRLYSL